MATGRHEFEGLPYGVYEAISLAGLVDTEKGNQEELITKFLDSWHRSSYAHFSVDEDADDRELAESRLIAYAKLWALMQGGPTDGETQHG